MVTSLDIGGIHFLCGLAACVVPIYLFTKWTWILVNASNAQPYSATLLNKEDDLDVSNDQWESMEPWHWRNSIYSADASKNPMGLLYQEQVAYFKRFSRESTLIEVGCGTAELFSQVAKSHFRQTIGIDISANMIECALETHPHLANPDTNCHLIAGNAALLTKELGRFSIGPDPICCTVMNTFGILPDHLRGLVLQEMWKTVSEGGKLVIGCWEKSSLPLCAKEYYAKYPNLCGQVVDSDFDFAKGDFKCADSGYTSHWWTAEELRKHLELAAPWPVDITFDYKGVGIFAIGKRRKEMRPTGA
eukprot:CAMPEP_0171606536 /NCGR_PEP_ID=MMETSP0990-20121206/7821_1 /TAXON_ID=483369 /ORGANISM="non described non described, Strain CCMP2098" /LENGTH=303 /DNA_ID=CAMNT_0012169391 /DNA_START=127 /DNA_END=1038 /DNA_ORIENTATION=+